MRSLKLREELVEISGRVFRLREHTGESFERYLEQQALTYRQAVEACAQEGSVNLLGTATELLISSEELYVWLLSDPQDGAPPPSREWVRQHLGPRMRRELIGIQDELNDLDDLLGKLKDLLTLAAARQQVETNQHLLEAMTSRSGSNSSASSPAPIISTP